MKRWLAFLLLTMCVSGCAAGMGAASRTESPQTFQQKQGDGGNGGGGGGGGGY